MMTSTNDAGVDFVDVQQLPDQVPVAVERFGLGGAALHLGVAFDAPTDRELGVDLDPHPEIPVALDLGPVREHAVDDEHAVRRHRRLHRPSGRSA